VRGYRPIFINFRPEGFCIIHREQLIYNRRRVNYA
jgi:hypothetical protein